MSQHILQIGLSLLPPAQIEHGGHGRCADRPQRYTRSIEGLRRKGSSRYEGWSSRLAKWQVEMLAELACRSQWLWPGIAIQLHWAAKPEHSRASEVSGRPRLLLFVPTASDSRSRSFQSRACGNPEPLPCSMRADSPIAAVADKWRQLVARTKAPQPPKTTHRLFCHFSLRIVFQFHSNDR